METKKKMYRAIEQRAEVMKETHTLPLLAVTRWKRQQQQPGKKERLEQSIRYPLLRLL